MNQFHIYTVFNPICNGDTHTHTVSIFSMSVRLEGINLFFTHTKNIETVLLQMINPTNEDITNSECTIQAFKFIVKLSLSISQSLNLSLSLRDRDELTIGPNHHKLLRTLQVTYTLGIVSSCPADLHSEKIGLIRVT